MNRYLNPGDKVYIGWVDPYGLVSRVYHPPTGKTPTGFRKNPIHGKKAYVVHYEGWDNGDGDFILRGTDDNEWKSSSDELLPDTQIEDISPEKIFGMARVSYDEHAVTDPELPPTHYYYVVVPRYGAYQFSDYEIEGDTSWLRFKLNSLIRGIVWRSRKIRRANAVALSGLSTRVKD